MYEGALRPIEVREATWEQLKFDQYGAIFNTSKKTGKSPVIRFIQYAPYLAAWKADYHPGTSGRGCAGICHGYGQILSRQYFDKIIMTAAEATGLKGVFPYILRHSRITAMVAQRDPRERD